MTSPQGDILVVDDQPVNVRLLATMLSQLGYKVRKATSGEMALTAIHAEPPDLILMDITMPQMDGYELCQILKQNPLTADIPIIFVSALDESMDKTKAFEVGAVDYVAKPFQWEEVKARVKTQMALRQLQQEALAASFSSIDPQRILWAASTPEIHPFYLTTPAFSNPSTELYDWHLTHPHLLHLILAGTQHNRPSSMVLLALLRGLFKGLSIEPNLEIRVARTQSFMEPDLKQLSETLRMFHGELNTHDCTLTYRGQGYALVLLRQGVATAQATAATLRLEPGDRLLIGNEVLQNSHLAQIEALLRQTEASTEPISEGDPVLLLHYHP